MKPRITIITLGVDDLDKSLTFYRDGLGLSTQGIIGKEFEHGAVVFFELQNGVKLALWPRTSIAHDTHLPVQAPSATEFTLAHNVSSQEEVDQVMEQAKAAGATIIKSAQETFYGGYAGYFQDPDQHVWEIAWNPQLLPDSMEDDAALEQFWYDYVRSHPSLQGQRYYEAFRFGNTEQMANELAALVLSGVKTATSSLLWTIEQEKKSLMQAGDYSIVTDWKRHPVCVIQTTEVNIVPFKDVDAQFAYEYGEGERTLVWWKQHNWDYYVQECTLIGRQATEDMPLVCERFRVVYKP